MLTSLFLISRAHKTSPTSVNLIHSTSTQNKLRPLVTSLAVQSGARVTLLVKSDHRVGIQTFMLTRSESSH